MYTNYSEAKCTIIKKELNINCKNMTVIYRELLEFSTFITIVGEHPHPIYGIYTNHVKVSNSYRLHADDTF